MSWPLVELGSVANFINGFAFKPAHWETEGKPIIRIQNLTNSNKPFNYSTMEVAEKYNVKKGDLLVSWSATLDVFEWAKEDALLNQHIFKVEPDFEKIDKNYLRFALRDAIESMMKFTRGSTMKHVNRGDFLGTKIPLPPLPVQKQIAAVLEKADTLRSQCQQMEQELNTLAKSVFLELFGDPVKNPKGWEVKKFKDICSSQLGKMLSEKAKKGTNPKKYLRNANIRWRKIELHDLLEMDFNEREMKKFTLEYGDLLVCEGGDVGRCAIWKDQLSDCYYQKALHRVRVDNEVVTSEYIQEYFYWMSKLGGLSASVSEVTFSHLTAAKMAELNVPVPPIELQVKYKEKVEALNSQLIQTTASSHDFSDLFNSLMQRAFKGELKLKDVA